jgi:hypothetical protein
MNCRAGCGACCIAPSISSPIPGMPEGKPAGVRCVQLTGDNRCRLFGRPERPAVCVALRPDEEMCGESADAALAYLTLLDRLTRPSAQRAPGPVSSRRSKERGEEGEEGCGLPDLPAGEREGDQQSEEDNRLQDDGDEHQNEVPADGHSHASFASRTCDRSGRFVERVSLAALVPATGAHAAHQVDEQRD